MKAIFGGFYKCLYVLIRARVVINALGDECVDESDEIYFFIYKEKLFS